MERLVGDAVSNGFDGYALDMVCGGQDASQSITFFNAFAALMHPLGKTVSWWTHYSYSPDLSFPNAADYVYTMDR